MNNITTPSVGVNAIPVLTISSDGENFQMLPVGNHCHQESSHTLNNSSVPKSIENNTENNEHEKVTDEAYAEMRQKCIEDIENLTGKALSLTYPKEYKTWSNSKNRSKKLKGIAGSCWGVELDTFPGFLRYACPKRNLDDSLDRIDPSCGYVVGNIRWASKQLQSENRSNVETIMVRGVPMTKPQLAMLLGISYDALRMRINRGDTVEDIIAAYFKTEKPAVKSLAEKIEACPWPEGKENVWETAFQVERKQLLEPCDQASRTAFLVAKSVREYSRCNKDGHIFADNHDYDEPLPADLVMRLEYWTRLKAHAMAQWDLAHPKPDPVSYSVEPTEEELSMIEIFSGAPSAITDEDVGCYD